MEIAGAPNLADYFPVLRPLDPHGLLRRSKFYKKLLAIFEKHISERLHVRSTSSSYASSEDLTDLLLNIGKDQNSSISLNDMHDLFLVGTDTTSNTLEWAMAELIHNLEKMLKARAEIKKVIGNDERAFEESDISRVPYLRAIIKETLRLHPPVTFLVPHKAITDVEIKGYMVPKDAQIMCNMWAMGQDPNVWSDPQRFKPERFLEVEIDFKGRDFEFIPFGAGRRMCPGLPLADIMLHLMLGSLIHKFDWKIEGGSFSDPNESIRRVSLSLNGGNRQTEFVLVVDVVDQKSYVDKRRKPLEFQVGDRVLLKVSPWKGVVRFGKRGKLNPRYVGPFEIIERIGKVAYKLNLPAELGAVHNVSHVSNLKKCLSDETLIVPLKELTIDEQLHFVEEPVEITDWDVKVLKNTRILLV
ncbi:putative geraniol 8-hydroxylase [Helianthus annuus]|nr:putative geraniol 8-hydroxylase [Helianthus annuus]KAJ0517715.1 putative geraniol 8-hydroxylase [Helianthus annuus]KAJ0685732.1 putative geraniol 8-hydroxylase [Helianthus annuus]KAJ0689607.1 putative geraniol 8-hydroxylase [Helianthus annuus]